MAINPFGGYNDEDVRRAVSWLIDVIGADTWKFRKKKIEVQIQSSLAPKSSQAAAYDHNSLSISDDKIAWYLYLAEAALERPFDYEPMQGARVVPIFKRIGAELPSLLAAKGIEHKAYRLVWAERRQPDSILFELLIALLWKRNGWNIEFLPEQPPTKQPDIRATRNGEEWFVECKRLSSSSGYSNAERAKWLTMWKAFRDTLISQRISFVFDIRFHKELNDLPDSFLVDELAGRLAQIHYPGKVVSNDTWDVDVRTVDYAHVKDHLSRYMVRIPSDQLNELVGGGRDPNRGFTSIVKGRIATMGDGGGSNRFLDELEFAAGAFWSCDSPRAIEQKARDIRKHLSDAYRQLPASGNGAVHVGLETLDGALVEEERFRRISNSIYQFAVDDRRLKWIYCHLFQSYSPPNEMWSFDETVYQFGQSGNPFQPLPERSAVVPAEKGIDGTHWERPTP